MHIIHIACITCKNEKKNFYADYIFHETIRVLYYILLYYILLIFL
jgi:hypothetical protein